MGREIRRVPPNWEHPKSHRPNGGYGYRPQYDQSYAEACKEWIEGFEAWQRGERDEWVSEDGSKEEYWDYSGMPPDKVYYVDYAGVEPTWYQAYDTVSEGTPTSPPFATEEELIEYLAENGDFWDQKRCHEPNWKRLWGGTPGISAWGRERAEAFVRSAWAPSMVIQGNKIMSGTEALIDAAAPSPVQGGEG